MKIPAKPQNIKQCQKLKKSIWDNNTQVKKQDNAVNIPISKVFTSQRTLRVEKSRMFKASNPIDKANILTRNNSQKYKNNQTSIKFECKANKNQQKTYDNNINENIDCVLDQLESYEKIKLNSSSIFNSSLSQQRYNVESIEEELPDKIQVKQPETNKTKQQPLADITNRICLKLLQKQNSVEENRNSENKTTSSLVSTKPCSQNTILEEDDESERIQSQLINQKNLDKKQSQNLSIASTNNTSSASSVDNHIKQQQSILASSANIQQSTNMFKQKNVDEKTQYSNNSYLEGYKVFKKKDKLFTFKVFREDSLKIPVEFSQVITHGQDDDVSSDEDVVKGGIKFNYKSILKEIYDENQIAAAPQIVISHKYFL